MIVPGRTRSSWRRLVIAGAIAACGSAMTALIHTAPARAQQAESIHWSIDSVEPGHPAGQLQLTIDSRWGAGNLSTWSNTRSLAELQGLSTAQLMDGGQPVRFALVRDAGRLDCGGTARGGRGSGACTFTPDPNFAAYAAAHGIGRPTARQAFSLTMSGVGREVIEALDLNGFARPNIDQLTSMGIQGVTAGYVRDLGSRGYHLSADDLIAFKIQGVEPEYFRALAAISPRLQHISPADVVKLHIHGVAPEFVREMAAIGPGFQNLGAEDLVSMSIHGVRPELARAYVQLEGGPLRTDDVVAMAIHGVTAEYIRQLAALGYRNLQAQDLVNMAIHGVTPGFVGSLRRAGMAALSADQLVRLRISGFDPDAR
jgi:hypothetical protein